MSKILVIDDSESIRGQMEQYLLELNHTCTCVGNGSEAMNLLKTEYTFDLVITDIFMPEMDGIETIEKIVTTYPHARIIAVSAGGMGMSGAGMLEVATGLGAVAVIHKPFQSPDFKRVVAEVLES